MEAHWNSQLEKILSNEGERSLCYSWLHNKAEALYQTYSTWINIPTIVLSTVAGSASIGSESLFGTSPYASIGIGCISLTVGILNTISGYFSWTKRAETHRLMNISYAKIHRFIMIELSLPRNERMSATEMLKFVREQLDRLQETSPQIPPSVIKEFRAKFGSTTDDVSKPEITNGLDPIEVFKEEV